jgi:hypothetical protein
MRRRAPIFSKDIAHFFDLFNFYMGYQNLVSRRFSRKKHFYTVNFLKIRTHSSLSTSHFFRALGVRTYNLFLIGSFPFFLIFVLKYILYFIILYLGQYRFL